MVILPPVNAGEGDLRKISDEVWRNIVINNDPPKLFRNGDRIVWMEQDDCDVTVLREVTQPKLKHHLVREMRFFRRDKDGRNVSARPPKDLLPIC